MRPTPRCIHCVNVGMPSDHWLRATMDPKSPIVCQVLLNTECLFCHQKGHTAGHCAMKKSVDKVSKQHQKLVRREQYKSMMPKSQERVSNNESRFASIYVDDDVEDEVKTEKPVTQTASVRTWASIVKQPRLETPSDESDEEIASTMALNQQWAQTQVNKKVLPRTLFKRSWADYSDSDSDSE
jgi:hypothetical protein